MWCGHRNGQGSHAARVLGFFLLLEEQVSKGKSDSKYPLCFVLELRILSGPMSPTSLLDFLS